MTTKKFRKELVFEYGHLMINFDALPARLAPRKRKLRLAELGKKKRPAVLLKGLLKH